MSREKWLALIIVCSISPQTTCDVSTHANRSSAPGTWLMTAVTQAKYPMNVSRRAIRCVFETMAFGTLDAGAGAAGLGANALCSNSGSGAGAGASSCLGERFATEVTLLLFGALVGVAKKAW
mmetsp:Transcript_9131/g.24523  ORF Transcript_9131/g.24523 Transcript_9131/m.24523 type:complete len:122 (+) Transcript_9131:486-851(+)